jgi:thioredoxin-related protein
MRVLVMKKLLLDVLLVSSIAAFTGMKSIKKDDGVIVKWMTLEQAIEKSKTEKRKIIIDVYTDWCGWCKVMDKNTFSEPAVAKLLNDKFYAVKFDAEQTEDVVFRGTTYKFIPQGNSGVHQFAAALLNNQLSYPTVVFIEEDFKSVSPIPGFKKADEFHKMLTFFSQNYYKNGEAGRAEFEKVYKSPYAVGK